MKQVGEEGKGRAAVAISMYSTMVQTVQCVFYSIYLFTPQARESMEEQMPCPCGVLVLLLLLPRIKIDPRQFRLPSSVSFVLFYPYSSSPSSMQENPGVISSSKLRCKCSCCGVTCGGLPTRSKGERGTQTARPLYFECVHGAGAGAQRTGRRCDARAR